MKIRVLALLAAAVCVAAAAGCGKKEEPDGPSDVSSVPSYTQYAPPEETSQPAATSDPNGTAWPEGATFFEDFSAAGKPSDRGWTANPEIKNGLAELDGNCNFYLLSYMPALSWTDYTVECTFTPAEAVIAGGANSAVASLAGRAISTSSGYELGFVVSRDGTAFLRLYNRTGGAELARDDAFEPKAGKEYDLKMVFSGSRVICFVDGKKYFDLTVSEKPNPTGAIGVRCTNGMGATVKNIIVRPVSDADLK